MDSFLVFLLVKVVSTASVVVVASVAAERLGPFWGGLVACLPVSAGPAYVLLAMQHDAAFIAGSALSSLACGVATWAFLLTFIRLGQHFSIAPSLFGALSVWLAVAVSVRFTPWSVEGAVLINIVAFALALKFTPVPKLAAISPRLAQRWFELPLRGLIVGVFVALVVALSDAIGPMATGIAAVFPITLSSLAVIMSRSFGMAGATMALSAAVKPLIGIVIGLLVLVLSAESLGAWSAMALGLAASMLWPLGLILQRKLAT
ncbi:MAG: hypothetical protein EXR11_10565 [Rhodospirillaceae bacterium]|nr:hypothetical protein [Rhodospirillaceae bacterium]